MARPESSRNTQVRREISLKEPGFSVTAAMPQLTTSTTVVRMAVARLESTPATPILASTAVMPANKAEIKAHPIQFILEHFR